MHNPSRNVTQALCCLYSCQGSGRSLELPCVREEPFENSLHVGKDSVSQLVVIAGHEVRQKMFNTREGEWCRLRTPRGVAVEEAAFFSVLKLGTYVALRYVEDLDVWHEALVTWPSVSVDRAAAILTPMMITMWR